MNGGLRCANPPYVAGLGGADAVAPLSCLEDAPIQIDERHAGITGLRIFARVGDGFESKNQGRIRRDSKARPRGLKANLRILVSVKVQ